MKKLKSTILIVAALSIISAFGSYKNINSETYRSFKKFDNDTLGYLKSNFYDHKEFYKEKELGVLLNKIELPIKSYTPIFNINDVTGIYISLFYDLKEKRYKLSNKEKTHNLIVEFRKPIPVNEISNMLLKNKGNWTKDEAEFFGKQIVKDIDLMDYDK